MTQPDDSELVREMVELLLDRRRADKELGQHFLIDSDLLQHAVEIAGCNDESHVLEVGSGPGTLTHFLLNSGARVTTLEIDEEAVAHIHRIHSQHLESGRLTVIGGDALRATWPNDLTHVVANPPYQISSPLLHRIDEWQAKAKREGGRGLQCVVLLLQEEFAIRLTMADGSISRGPLGIKTALNWRCELGRPVSPHCFSPHPQVRSRFVLLTPHDTIGELSMDVDQRLVRRMVEQVFKERRRKIRNRLPSVPRKLERVPGWSRERWKAAVDKLLSQSVVDGLPDEWQEMRPEEFEVIHWLKLAEYLEAVNGASHD